LRKAGRLGGRTFGKGDQKQKITMGWKSTGRRRKGLGRSSVPLTASASRLEAGRES